MVKKIIRYRNCPKCGRAMFLIDAGAWDIWSCSFVECNYAEDPDWIDE